MSSGFSSLPTLTTFYNALLSKWFLFSSEFKVRILEQGYEWKMPTNRRKVLAIALVLAFAASHDVQAQDVQRVDVREGGLVGHFYAAFGASGRTGVLMLGGSGGGYPDEAAARDLARAGYPVIALAYSRDYGGNPAELGQRQLR